MQSRNFGVKKHFYVQPTALTPTQLKSNAIIFERLMERLDLMKIMIYGQLQYYNDEIKAWLRIIDFYRNELHELQSQLNVLLSFPLVSLPHTKVAQALSDQLMVLEQQFDHARHLLMHQNQRLSHAVTSPNALEPAVIAHQGTCRSRIKTYELAFIKTKYNCSLFLSGFFQPEEQVAG